MNSRQPSLGIAIPCSIVQLQFIQQCLDSIAAQTRQPDHVVISCSSATPSDIPTFNYCFPLTIITHSGYMNPAQNRNYAASQLSTDLISFFDVMYVMHPQRLQAICSLYLKQPFSSLFHNYWDSSASHNEFQEYSMDTLKWHPSIVKRAPSGCVYIPTQPEFKIHQSHSTVHADIMKTIHYHEEPEYVGRDNAIFCGDVVSHSSTISLYIADILSKQSIQD